MTYGTYEKKITSYRFLVKEYVTHMNVEDMAILDSALCGWDGRMFTGFIWLKIGQVPGCCV